MKNYMPGVIISLIVFVILAVVNWQIYSNVMSLGVIILLLVLQVIFYKYLFTEKKRSSYVILALVFVVAVFFSLPALTYNQARAEVSKTYGMEILETYTVPVDNSHTWNPFFSNRAYFFKGYDSKSEEDFSVMVSANTGEVFLID